MSRSLLFHMFIYMCVLCYNMSRSLLFHVFIYIYVCVYYVKRVATLRNVLFSVFMFL